MTTLVLGHKSPDTDSTGSPLIWAWYLSEVKNTPAKAVLLGEPNTEAAFMLKHWGFAKPEIIADVTADDKVVIVDTNNPAELPPSINEADVIEIIDHHLLAGGIKTRLPINITIRPLACTATIMHDLIGDEDLARAPKAVKGAMLTCILSDTLEFRSPTTTPHDRAVAEKLARDLGLSIPDYAAEMFAAKSGIETPRSAASFSATKRSWGVVVGLRNSSVSDRMQVSIAPLMPRGARARPSSPIRSCMMVAVQASGRMVMLIGVRVFRPPTSMWWSMISRMSVSLIWAGSSAGLLVSTTTT